MPPNPSLPLRHSDPLVGESFYVDRQGTRWAVELEYLDVDGRLTPFGMRIRSYEITGRGPKRAGRAVSLNDRWRALSTAALRSFAMSQVETENRQRIDFTKADDVYDDEGLDPDLVQVYDRAEYLASLSTSPGRRAVWPDQHWHEVAGVYRRALAEGRNPSAAVAAHYRDHGRPISSATARSWVRRCRQLGLLPPTQERKPRA